MMSEEVPIEALILVDKPLPMPANAVLIRADLVDFWRLLADNGVRLARHYNLYPNPWPKIGHLARRWHGHPVFPALLELGGVPLIRRQLIALSGAGMDEVVVVDYTEVSGPEHQRITKWTMKMMLVMFIMMMTTTRRSTVSMAATPSRRTYFLIHPKTGLRRIASIMDKANTPKNGMNTNIASNATTTNRMVENMN